MQYKEAASKSRRSGGVNTFSIKNGLSGPIVMKVGAFERGDQGASLEKKNEVIWRCFRRFPVMRSQVTAQNR